MSNVPGMAGEPFESPQSGAGSSGRVIRIVVLVFIGLVVLCGLLGSCLFAFTLVAPLLFPGTPTPAP